MKVRRSGIMPDEAVRMAAIMAAAFTERERGWSAGELAALAAMPGVIVVVADAGFAAGRVAADEAEVLTVAVEPGAQGQGLGTALIDRLLSETRVARLFLEVAESNLPARRLYARAGFTETARRKDYFLRADGSREDALVLELRQ